MPRPCHAPASTLGAFPHSRGQHVVTTELTRRLASATHHLHAARRDGNLADYATWLATIDGLLDQALDEERSEVTP